MSEPKKIIYLLGEVWDYAAILRVFNSYGNTTFISFQNPKTREEQDDRIPSHNIVSLEEKPVGVLLKLLRVFFVRPIRVAHMVKELKPDVVMSFHDDANMTLCLVRFYSLFLFRYRPTFGVWVRNNPLLEHRHGLRAKVIFFAYTFLFGSMDYIITQTKENSATVKALLRRGAPRFFEFENPIDTEINNKLSCESIQEELEKKIQGKLCLVTLGRLTLQKGQWHLFRILKWIRENGINYHLIVVNDGDMLQTYQVFLREMGMEDVVTFVGFQKNPYKFFIKADIVLSTSLWEGFSNTLIEGLSLGKPIITSDCPFGMKEIVDPNRDQGESVTYPHFAPYGILCPPLEREVVLIDPGKAPLSESEMVYASALKRLILEKDLRDGYKARSKERVRLLDMESSKLRYKNLIDAL